MRSDHLAKHTKTHENKIKKMIAKSGQQQQDKKPMEECDVKSGQVDVEDLQPSVFPTIDTPAYVEHQKPANIFAEMSAAEQQAKPSIEDFYQSHYPYQYGHPSGLYASNYYYQNPFFYQDKNFAFEQIVNDQNRAAYQSLQAGTGAPQPPNVQYSSNPPVALYQQSPNLNSPLNNININASNLIISINDTSNSHQLPIQQPQ